MAKYESLPRHTTPVGTAVYPHLHAPDTKYKTEGEYATKARFEGDAADAMREYLDDMCDQAWEAGKQELIDKGKAKTLKAAEKMLPPRREPYTVELDEETGDETGAIIVNFKMKASGVSKKTGRPWSRKPRLFDAAGQPIPVGLKIGSGSQIRINFEPSFYTSKVSGTGVTCRLEAVQIIDLQTWSGLTAEKAGFDVVDGFSVDEADEDMFAGEVPAPATADGLDASDDDEDIGDEGDF